MNGVQGSECGERDSEDCVPLRDWPVLALAKHADDENRVSRSQTAGTRNRLSMGPLTNHRSPPRTSTTTTTTFLRNIGGDLMLEGAAPQGRLV